MKVAKAIGIVFGILLFVFAIGWVVEGNAFAMFYFWAPKTEAVKRQVYEQTPSYVKGMVQELSAMQRQYILATPDQKRALRPVILNEVAGFNLNDPDVPNSLRIFINELQLE